MSAIWVEVVDVRGSAPRESGTAMKVTADSSEGTIGGGALEYQAIATARELLGECVEDVTRTYPLGPDLGQCCGGAVTLLYTQHERMTDPIGLRVHKDELWGLKPRHLWLWGAGHVGRAVVRALHPRAFKITWVDRAPDRFPDQFGKHIKAVPAANMPLLAKRTPKSAHHLIFTYSHDIDLELCAALLDRGAASIGLIGSDTKRARFFKRLADLGFDPTPIQCPIGDKSLGKSPDAIATGVARQLMSRTCDRG